MGGHRVPRERCDWPGCNRIVVARWMEAHRLTHHNARGHPAALPVPVSAPTALPVVSDATTQLMPIAQIVALMEAAGARILPGCGGTWTLRGAHRLDPQMLEALRYRRNEIVGYLRQRVTQSESFALRDYQIEAVETLANPPAGITRSLMVLATGGGKTIVFASLLDRVLQPGQRGLVLAHREELLTQARDKIAMVAPSLQVEIEQADLRASKKWNSQERGVVVASVQSMRGARLQQWAPDAFSTVIIDECHHSAAKTYGAIIEHFGCMSGNTRLIGVTATPKRSDGVALGAIFQEIAFERHIREMISDGYLVPIRAWQVRTGTDLRQVKITAGDYNARQLEQAVNNERRNYEILGAYEQYGAGLQAVVFCAGVSHAQALAKLFTARGHPALAMWGMMRSEERTAALESYARGVTRVLTNHSLLSEGWDSPQTQCLILARPTKSELVYTQQLGRALRPYPGKDYMVAVDVADVTAGKSLVNAATLAGLPQMFDPKGGDVHAMSLGLDEIDPRLHRNVTDRATLERLLAKTKAGMSVAQIDVFAAIAIDETIRSLSHFAWVSTGIDRWAVRADKGFTYEIHVDVLEQYVLTHLESMTVLETSGSKAVAFSGADRYIRRHHAEKEGFLDVRAHWRKAEASEKQITLLGRLAQGLEIPPNLSKGDASRLIDSLIYARRR
jgi:ATP-dependent helicase IRC3